MPEAPFVSYAQNREDVVLWRALHDVDGGRYVEIGGNDPVKFSVVKAFSDHGWTGMSVEPDPSFAARLREARPDDVVVEAAVTSRGDEVTLHLIEDTGLSTLDDAVSERHAGSGYPSREVTVRGARLDALLAEHGFEQDVQFAVIDVEGLEADVLSTVDLRSWRPWVLVVEATAPLSHTPTHGAWEPEVLAAGYELCLFDGISRFYVATEHADRLKESLSYGAGVLDEFITAEDHIAVQRLNEHIEALEGHVRGLREQASAARAQALEEVLRWRRSALQVWAGQAAAAGGASGPEVESLRDRIRHLEEEAERTRQTVSWRVTAPLRVVRRRAGRR